MSNVLIFVEQAGGELKKASLQPLHSVNNWRQSAAVNCTLRSSVTALTAPLKVPKVLAQPKFTLLITLLRKLPR